MHILTSHTYKLNVQQGYQLPSGSLEVDNKSINDNMVLDKISEVETVISETVTSETIKDETVTSETVKDETAINETAMGIKMGVKVCKH
jgi:hypothetical protein